MINGAAPGALLWRRVLEIGQTFSVASFHSGVENVFLEMCDTEISDQKPVRIGVEKYVLRLQVSVPNPLLMCYLDSRKNTIKKAKKAS